MNFPISSGLTGQATLYAERDSEVLKNLVHDSGFAGKVFPATTVEMRGEIDAVYSLGGCNKKNVLHAAIATESIFLLSVRVNTESAYGDLVSAVDAISQLVAETPGISIDDVATGYNEASRHYEMALEINITTPPASPKSAVFIEGKCTADAPIGGCGNTQSVTCQEHYVLTADSSDGLSDMLDETQAHYRDKKGYALIEINRIDIGGGLYSAMITYAKTKR